MYAECTNSPVREEWRDRFALPAEDYLHGIVGLVNELVCFHPCLEVFRQLYITYHTFVKCCNLS
jgi:hypothetical protein